MKKKYVKVQRPGMGGYTIPIKDLPGYIEAEFDCQSEFDCQEVGDQLRLTVVEMTEEEYNKLPEFKGW